MRPEFASLRNHPDVSVLIVGGGINGIGLLNELALQGIDVLLVEKSDFCAGTSAAMTRVIHGGLRYLENAEFRLVRESLRERNRLLSNAPHYVKPLPTTIPIFNWTSGMVPAIRNLLGWPAKPGNRGALLIKTGLTLYDFLAGRESPLPRHRFRSRRAALALRPALNPEVICTATYYDARITYPERLCLELVQDAEAAFPEARALNYVRLQSAAGGAVVLRDEVSGETCEVRPRIVVNATGAWIDFTNRGLGRESRFIGGTKGSHIVLDHPELVEATGDEMIYFVNRDGRICIFYAVHGKIIAGATDIPDRRSGGGLRRSRGRLHSRSHAAGVPFDPRGPVARRLSVLRRPPSAAQRRPHPRPDQPRPQLPGAAAGQRNRFPDLLAGRRKVDHLPRAGRAGGGRNSARAGTPANPRFGGSSHRRRQGLPQDAGGHRTAPGAAGCAAGALWHGGGQSRRLLASGPGCAARLSRRLLPPGDRIHGAPRAGGPPRRSDPAANADGLAGRGEPALAGRTGGDHRRRCSSGRQQDAAAEVERTVRTSGEGSRRDRWPARSKSPFRCS